MKRQRIFAWQFRRPWGQWLRACPAITRPTAALLHGATDRARNEHHRVGR